MLMDLRLTLEQRVNVVRLIRLRLASALVLRGPLGLIGGYGKNHTNSSTENIVYKSAIITAINSRQV
jgi:hypothetical protein